MGRKTVIGRCTHCGIKRRMHRNHIIPMALGGSDDPENIQLLCANCHEDKNVGDMREIMTLPKYLEISRLANIGNTRNLGYKHTPETRANMSASKIGNSNALGHTFRHTDEAKARISRGMATYWKRRRVQEIKHAKRS